MNRQKSFHNDRPTLYLVATPIGNLDDITYRAVKTLQEVDVVYCEDTRVSGKLLQHYDIRKPLKSYHDFNKELQTEEILRHLEGGDAVALISDAGMPLVSDPGYHVVQAAIEHDYNVVSIPGPSAVLTALTVSGLPPHPFLFYGFLDSKTSKREAQLEALKEREETLVFYESPHRIHKTIASLYKVLGERDLVLARELTKKFEEIIRGTTVSLQDVLDVKGEMVLVVAGNSAAETIEVDMTILEEVNALIAEGQTSKDAIKQVAKRRNLTKNEVYMTYHQSDHKE